MRPGGDHGGTIHASCAGIFTGYFAADRSCSAGALLHRHGLWHSDDLLRHPVYEYAAASAGTDRRRGGRHYPVFPAVAGGYQRADAKKGLAVADAVRPRHDPSAAGLWRGGRHRQSGMAGFPVPTLYGAALRDREADLHGGAGLAAGVASREPHAEKAAGCAVSGRAPDGVLPAVL